jgi:membrane-bound metal-dependent hydrolase YbcI (DUF457 family)
VPSVIFSHQAPGLAIKVKYPKKFDGTALCFSTFIPDMNSVIDFFFPISLRGLTHSLIGIILWTVPLTIIATILFCKFIGPLCSNIANNSNPVFEPLRYVGVDDWHLLNKKKFDKRFFLVATYSAMLGGLTHLILDLPSHADIQLLYPWFLWENPDFLLYSIVDFGTFFIGPLPIDLNITVYNLIWQIESVIGFFICIYFLRKIKTRNLLQEWYEGI